MSVTLVKTFATDFLEYKNLISSCVICEHCSLNYRTFNIRSTDTYLTLVINEKYFVELHCSTFCLRKTVAEDLVACLNFKLLACNFYDCVHTIKLL